MDGGGNVAGHLVDEHQAADFRNRFFGALLIIEKGCETVHERCLLLLHNGGEFRESLRGILPRLKLFAPLHLLHEEVDWHAGVVLGVHGEARGLTEIDRPLQGI